MNRVVLVVGGIGGNQLSLDIPVLGRSVVWLNQVLLVLGTFERLRLAQDGVNPFDPAWGPAYPGGLLTDYYGTLLSHLSRRAWVPIGVVGDWRRSIWDDAEHLVDLVRRYASGADPLAIVTHSRGGLVARAALELLRRAEQQTFVRQVIALGCPHTGSLEPIQLFGGYQRTKLLMYHLLGRFNEQFMDPSLSYVNRTMCSWPVVYQTMPKPLAPWMEPDKIAALYNPLTWATLQPEANSIRLGWGTTWWASLPIPPLAVPWCDVVGVEIGTPISYYDLGRMEESTNLNWTGDGDGVVPVDSARSGFGPTVFSPTGHNALPYDGRIIYYVDKILSEGISSDVRIAGSILR